MADDVRASTHARNTRMAGGIRRGGGGMEGKKRGRVAALIGMMQGGQTTCYICRENVETAAPWVRKPVTQGS